MVKVTSKYGEEKDLCLDFDAIVEMENKNPNYSFMKEMESFGDNPRLATIDRLARFIYDGKGWVEFSKDGFTVKDLTAVVRESMAELGFTSEDSASEE